MQKRNACDGKDRSDKFDEVVIKSESNAGKSKANI